MVTLALLASVIAPSSTALAHTGNWRWVPFCGLGFCWYRLQWQRHLHSDDREARYEECKSQAFDKYSAHLWQIEHSDVSEERKKVERELARRVYVMDMEDCESLHAAGE